jgi:catechol 2,3-dioxygenase-like lactoylglutathione lyase family enzyme
VADVAVSLIVLRSADLPRAEAFYNLLGVLFDRERHGSGPEHLAARLGSLIFELYPLEGGGGTSSVRLGFRVASVKEIVAKLAEAGARIVTPPTNGTWGQRAVVADPDGHRIELVERESDDTLMDELLASDPKFQALVAKSEAGPRKPFSPGRQD